MTKQEKESTHMRSGSHNNSNNKAPRHRYENKGHASTQRLSKEQILERQREHQLARQARIPALSVPANLPVAAFVDELQQAIAKHSVVIVAGETGSGKTTQLPKLALAAGCGLNGWIGHTQPRRLAARMVAARLAEELGSPLGGPHALVGSKVRFADHSHPDHLIKVMTDGVLLMELIRDRRLQQYDTLIIDEAHERSLNIDFLLGYLKQLQVTRPELKLIITSATLDSDRFSAFFEGAPILNIPGKTYPIEMRYRPLYENELEMSEGIFHAIDELQTYGSGDVLVFLPGEREIRETQRYLEGKISNMNILPLYSRLNAAAQERIFHPKSSERRVILATNVAETSLTVPGIRYVVDTGLARISRYLPRQKIERLQVEPIDQSSARQRAGRCGRTMPGVCIRLYAEEDLLARPAYPDPEVLRTSLAGVVLKMAALHMGSVESFPWLNPPASRAIVEAHQSLQELGALDDNLECTTLGKALSKLPLEPRLGAMLLSAHDQDVLMEALIILSGHATGDPRERPLEKAQAADQAHRIFVDERSDFLGWLKLWDAIETHTEGKTRRQQQDWFDRNFINGRRVHEWQAFFDQLAEQLDTLGWSLNKRHIVSEPQPNQTGSSTPSKKDKQHSREASSSPQALGADVFSARLHQALLIGVLDWVGQWQPEHQSYLGSRGQRFQIHPSSALKKRKPLWIMAGEQIETTQRFGREVAECDPAWIEHVAAHRLSRQYLEPHWEHKTQQPVAFERISFGQLVLFARRKVRYAPIDPEAAREIMLRDALVGGRLECDLPFWIHHRSQLQRLEEWQIRDRSHRALLDEERLYRWYADKIPAEIFDLRSLKQWHNQLEPASQQALEWAMDDVVWQSDGVEWKQFPDEWVIDGISFHLRYCYDPKRNDDGVTLEVPLPHLNRLSDDAVSWNVPGLWREIIADRIKALPKLYRQRFLPPDAWVTRFLEHQTPFKENLETALWQFLRSQVHEWKTEAMLPWDKPRPQHLALGLEVQDEKGEAVGYFRSVDDAKAAFSQQAGQAFQETVQDVFAVRYVPSWDWPAADLAQSVQWGNANNAMTVFSALQAEGDQGVALQYFETSLIAEKAHLNGVLHLLKYHLKRELEQQIPQLKNATALMLPFRSVADVEAWQRALTQVVLQRAAWGEDEVLPWKVSEFDVLKQRTRTRLPAVVQAALQHMQSIGQAYIKLNQAIQALQAGHPLKTVAVQRRDRLLPADWMALTPWSQWGHLSRYLEALNRRVQRYAEQRDRDSRNSQNWENWWNRWQASCQRWIRVSEPVPAVLLEFRWQLEELAVSLWAQELKTPYPISFKRIEKTWEGITKELAVRT
ncbi:MAG: ATP-dependent RNA helicase HrpA [Pseudomonadota bacterium]